MSHPDLQKQAVILVVEDEAILRMVAASFFEDAGFEVVEAADTGEALTVLESREDIHLVFTDIDLPPSSVNGLTLAQAVTDRWPPIKIVIVSGHDVPGEGTMLTGSRFFPKPYRAEEMIATVREMLSA
jgi:CheY-like chemotaxis protein